MRRGKYNAKRVECDGITFASIREAKRYKELKLLEKAGVIHNLELQPEFPISINGIKCFTYKGDFVYFDDNKRVVEDVKGMKTPIYRLKKKCVEAYYSIKIVEV